MEKILIDGKEHYAIRLYGGKDYLEYDRIWYLKALILKTTKSVNDGKTYSLNVLNNESFIPNRFYLKPEESGLFQQTFNGKEMKIF